MKILLFGSNGQVGWELQRSLAPLGQLTALSRPEADLTDLKQLRSTVEDLRPHIVVNAAGYTAVDQAESEPDLATCINARAPAVLAQACAGLDACLVHYSTDYVFDGTKNGAYTEDDAVHPLNAYGRTKEEGERLIRQARAKHLIFRTSWVYANRGRNFPATILRLARERDALEVVNDQFGAPTSAELIADVTAHALHAIANAPSIARLGTYNLVARGETNWHAFARFLLEHAALRGVPLRCKADDVRPVSSAQRPAGAVRPANSRLGVDKLEHAFGLSMPHWEWHATRWIEAFTRSVAKG